ncbi:hypothetical protein H0H93_013737 [Arthromyces matolae]|nr:hypothetical protein H0H93_013737 [Arthromyces matolae]
MRAAAKAYKTCDDLKCLPPRVLDIGMSLYPRASSPAMLNGPHKVPAGASTIRDEVSSSVLSLLLATKHLQDLLKQWSTGHATEAQISDAFVQFGANFNVTINAFAEYNIDLSDIYSVSEELRIPLEQCLGDEPSPQALEQHMPAVRRALYRLFEGIKARRDAWRAAQRPLSVYPTY